MISRRGRAALCLGCAILVNGWISPVTAKPDFHFDRDTLAFTNMTVFDYHEGKVTSLGHNSTEQERTPRYTRRCFVMSRTVVQFLKFARFEPNAAPLDDTELAHRVRQVTRHAPYAQSLPSAERVVIPGYKNLRALSEKRGWVLQKNIGLGWPTYMRIGNYRMFYNHSKKYQADTHERMKATLSRGELFIGYLSDFPTLHINHAVMVYERKPPSGKDKAERYNCYDPNHPDGPRELVWFPDKQVFNFEKDEEFVGGFTRVFQVYGRPLQ